MRAWTMVAAAVYCFALATIGWSAGSASEVRFKSGEMGLLAYVEMASEAMGIQVSASALRGRETQPLTIGVSGPLNPEQAMAKLLSVLALQGFTLIHDLDLDFYHLLAMRDARDAGLPLIIDPARLPDNDLLVTHPIHLEHFPAEALARDLRSFAPASSRIIPDEANHQVFISDSARAMAKYHAIAARLDHPKEAADAREFLRARAKADPCAGPGGSSEERPWLFILLFSVLGLMLGFFARGYVIRRIEGGL